jgi:hypothetical protein
MSAGQGQPRLGRDLGQIPRRSLDSEKTQHRSGLVDRPKHGEHADFASELGDHVLGADTSRGSSLPS